MNLPPHFEYRASADADHEPGRLFIEGVSAAEVADRFGTPTYAYSRAALAESFDAYSAAAKAFGESDRTLICYAVKANSNLAVLNVFAALGAGFDIVSAGELKRVLAAGGEPGKTIFSGVGKTREEMRLALQAGILCFNVESIAELHRLNEVAGASMKSAPVSLRVNPDVDAKTHPYISTGLKESKFGIAFEQSLATYRIASRLPHLRVIGIDCHIGSQLLDDAPLLEALEKLIELVNVLAEEGIAIDHLDLGGVIGIWYGDENAVAAPIAVGDYLRRVFERIDRWQAHRSRPPIKVLFEPGRSLVGNAGVLLTRIEYLKPGATKNFAIVDAAMNDLMRPAMYEAWHGVAPAVLRTENKRLWDIVGPICESGDWLARNRELDLAEGDLLAFLSTGAYGMTMASNYNTRPRAAEVIVDRTEVHLVRERETVEQLFAGEHLLDS